MHQFYSIILVDDDPINNLINKRLISKLEVAEQVEEFLEAEKALERIDQLNSDEKTLILLDINMPVMNGWDFLNHYSQKFESRGDRIIMLSSSIDFQDRQKAKQYNCVEGFIEKPLTPDKFKNIL
ncbi:Response regulator receiver domain-containing protein [Belliella buryatensis]|uniref:Response regulator receiver domain-containing protein n=1 Tax=Belliella buryatensis TaxID=1500549 RepID=A0A239CKR6_9BACT|nr:response regulator [Belliella buryatensis]SNS20539.1 Response regulator receiver domain-containing protein [Belliella buryatensis]